MPSNGFTLQANVLTFLCKVKALERKIKANSGKTSEKQSKVEDLP